MRISLFFFLLLSLLIPSCAELRKQGTTTSQPVTIISPKNVNVTPSEGGVVGSVNIKSSLDSLAKAQLETNKNIINRGTINNGAAWVALVSLVILTGIIIMFMALNRSQNKELLAALDMIKTNLQKKK